MADSNKIYCGSAKPFGQYDTLKLDICLDDIPEEHIRTGKNGKRYVKVNLNKNKQIGKFGDTHNLQVDTWKPEHKPEYEGNREDNSPAPSPPGYGDIPWED